MRRIIGPWLVARLSQPVAEGPCGREVSQKFIATDCYTKYPLITASFHDLITDGTMPTGKSFSAFQKLCTPAPKRVMAI